MLSWQPAGAGDSPALEFGTRMHRAGALWWESGEAEVGSEYLRSQQWPLNDKHTQGLALQMYGAYVHSARPMPYSDDHWEFAAIEERVVMDVQPGLQLSFQLDRLMHNPATGAYALFDIKTASRCDARWAKQWQRDLQMKLYSEVIARKYGRAPDWIVVEGLSKDNATLNLVVLPEFSDAMRAEAWRDFEWVAIHDSQLLEACKLADGSVDTERLAQRVLSETPHSPAECFAYNGQCPYLPLCDAEPSERIALLREGYTYVEPEYV